MRFYLMPMEGGRFQSGLTSLVPFVATITMGVGTNIPILEMRRLRLKLPRGEFSH